MRIPRPRTPTNAPLDPPNRMTTRVARRDVENGKTTIDWRKGEKSGMIGGGLAAIIIGVLVVLGGGIGGYFLLKKDKSKPSSSEPALVQEPKNDKPVGDLPKTTRKVLNPKRTKKTSDLQKRSIKSSGLLKTHCL